MTAVLTQVASDERPLVRVEASSVAGAYAGYEPLSARWPGSVPLRCLPYFNAKAHATRDSSWLLKRNHDAM